MGGLNSAEVPGSKQLLTVESRNESLTLAPTRRKALVRSPAIYVLSLSLALFIGVISGWQFYYNSAYTKPLFETFLIQIVRYGIYGVLTPALLSFAIQHPVFDGPKTARNCGILMVGFPLFCISAALIRIAIMPPYDGRNNMWLPRSFETAHDLIKSNYVEQLLVYSLLIALGQSTAALYRERDRRESEVRLINLVARQELELLKMQLQPHFLFNTLHGIATLMLRDVSAARDMLLTLSDLLRVAIHHRATDMVRFQQEVEFAKKYLSIEKMRMGHKLNVDFAIDERGQDCLVPHMVLQPVLENAIVHGISSRIEGGTITVTSSIEDSRFRIVVTNPIGAPKRTKRHGIGLQNTRSRLARLFDESASLECSVNESMAVTTLVIPATREEQGEELP
jgi:two-component system, LytTR family, sensor kinase